MRRDTLASRGDRPYIFTNLKDGTGVSDVVDWIKREAFLVGLEA
jgi:urease accessory protein